jgi:hypothetical protein
LLSRRVVGIFDGTTFSIFTVGSRAGSFGMVATTGVVVSAFLFTPLFKVYKISKGYIQLLLLNI